MTHKIKITPRDAAHRRFVIEVDGMDLSGIVQVLNLSLVAGEMPNVTLELVPMEIEIPAELEAKINMIRDGVRDDE